MQHPALTTTACRLSPVRQCESLSSVLYIMPNFTNYLFFVNSTYFSSSYKYYLSKKKERKSIYIAPFIYYVYLKALRHGSHSFTCKYTMPDMAI